MKLPTIHSNGTGRKDLVEGYIAAARAIEDAMSAIRAIEFNARDYYVAGPAAWAIARAEMSTRITVLNAVKLDMQEIAMHCKGGEKP